MMPDLGKYAVEVMSSYLVSIGLIVALVAVSLRQSRRTREALRQVESERQAKQGADKQEAVTNG